MLVQIKCLIASRRSSLSIGLSSSSLEQVIKAYKQVNQCLVLKCKANTVCPCSVRALKQRNLLVFQYPPHTLYNESWKKKTDWKMQLIYRQIKGIWHYVFNIDVRATVVGVGQARYTTSAAKVSVFYGWYCHLLVTDIQYS